MYDHILVEQTAMVAMAEDKYRCVCTYLYMYVCMYDPILVEQTAMVAMAEDKYRCVCMYVSMYMYVYIYT